MKTLGIIGGMSWVSTLDYYRYINEGINANLGGLNFAQCLLYSFSYSEIVNNGLKSDLEANYLRLEEVAKMLEDDGAVALVLCANTAHMQAERLQQQLNIPIIHIGVAIADAIKAQGLTKVALLGTKFTMEMDFIKDKIRDKGIEVIVPEEEDRVFVHHTIHDELGKGEIRPETKARYIQISNELIAQGAQGIILGCTEIPLIIQPEDLDVPTFDTAKIHSDATVEFMLNV